MRESTKFLGGIILAWLAGCICVGIAVGMTVFAVKLAISPCSDFETWHYQNVPARCQK